MNDHLPPAVNAESTLAISKVFDSLLSNIATLKSDFEKAANSTDPMEEKLLYAHLMEAGKQFEIVRILVLRFYAIRLMAQKEKENKG